MQIKEAVLAALKEVVLPELAVLKQEQAGTRVAVALLEQRLDGVNKRLDDINVHLVDQSRRIDEMATRFDRRIDEMATRFDQRLDEMATRFDQRLDDMATRFDQRLDSLRIELSSQIMATNQRLNQLYEVIVRRDEHQQLDNRVQQLERDVQELKSRLAA